MNPSTARALERVLRTLERPPRRRGGFSTAPIVLGLGLVLGHQLLARLVPAVWATTLPGGFAQGRGFVGWPGVVWKLAVVSRTEWRGCLVILGIAVAMSIVAIKAFRPLRWLVWMATLSVILLDAGIVFVTMRTALAVTAQSAGLDAIPYPSPEELEP